MAKAIGQFASCAASIHFEAEEDCNVEFVVAKLRDVACGVDIDNLTVDSYNLAVSEQLQKQQEKSTKDVAASDEQQQLDASPISPTAIQLPARLHASPREKQTQKEAQSYEIGDVVEYLDPLTNLWADGEVINMASDVIREGGLPIAPGSVKITYANGSKSKWIMPQLVGRHIRMSDQPKAPLPKTGSLNKETHGWFSFWHARHVEVRKGFMRWWDTEENAKAGKAAKGMAYLLGLQQEVDGNTLSIRTSNTRGVVYIFQAATHAEAEGWSEVLWAHAGYCSEILEYVEAKQAGATIRRELTAMRTVKAEDSNEVDPLSPTAATALQSFAFDVKPNAATVD